MNKQRTKTLSYRRAVWLNTQPNSKSTLETYIAQAHKKLTRIGQRKISYGDGQILKAIRLKKGKPRGYFLHIVAETPGDLASTISVADDNKPDADVVPASPPKGSEFMDGDFLVFVRGNNVCMCSTVLHDGALALFLRELFDKAKLPSESKRFDLQKIANVQKLKLIQAQGVKSIEFNASVYDASLKYINRNDTPSILGSAAQQINAILGKNKAPNAEDLTIQVGLNADGRIVKTGTSAAKTLDDLAKDLINANDDNYSIITRSNHRITFKEVFVRTKASIPKHGKSVNQSHAWNALQNFHNNLEKSGVTEQ